MSKIAVGTIPQKISYVYSCTQNVNIGCEWDIDYMNDDPSQCITVTPSFPVGSVDEKALAAAKRWAEDKRKSYDHNIKNYVFDDALTTVDQIDNNPLKDIRVLSLEGRGEGRAYKVLINNKYYVDLREDVLVDVMLSVGIQAGGILNGEFVWAKLGAQMKLVRVGSELHKLLEDSNAKKDLPKINKNDLEIGGVYKSRAGDKAVFLGYVNTINNSIIDANNTYKIKENASVEVKQTPIKKAMLFFDLIYSGFYDDDGDNKSKKINSKYLKINSKDYDYSFKIMTTHNFIEKINTLIIKEDHIKLLREYNLKEIKDDILEFTGHKKTNTQYAKISKKQLSMNIAYASKYLNLSKYGEPLEEPFNLKKYLLFT